MSELAKRLHQWSKFGYGHEASKDMREAGDQLIALEAENKALRDGLRVVSSALFHARSYRGYKGGPLSLPFTEMAENRARYLLAKPEKVK